MEERFGEYISVTSPCIQDKRFSLSGYNLTLHAVEERDAGEYTSVTSPCIQDKRFSLSRYNLTLHEVEERDAGSISV